MTEIERLLADLGLDAEVLHEGTGRRCPDCEPPTEAVRLPAAA